MTEADIQVIADTRKAMALIESNLPDMLSHAESAVSAQADNALLNLVKCSILFGT